MIDFCKAKYGELFQYEESRALIFHQDDRLPIEALRDCLTVALTYHLKKREREIKDRKRMSTCFSLSVDKHSQQE